MFSSDNLSEVYGNKLMQNINEIFQTPKICRPS